MGPYGRGPYGRWGGNTFDVAGATGIAFDATITAPQTIHQLLAPTGITFDVWTVGANIELHPSASTEIVFSAQAHMALTWETWAPCELGGWAASAPCEGGAWVPSQGCSAGVWTEDRLV